MIYLLTRIHGLYTHLLTDEDYSTLIKSPDIRHIMDYLIHSEYGEFISSIPTEQLSARSLIDVISKIFSDRLYYPAQFTSGSIRSFLIEYARRIEVENIKRVLRAKFGMKTVTSEELIPIPRGYQEINFSAMVEAPNIEAALEYITVSIYTDAPQYLITSKEIGSLMPLEAYVENKYYERIFKTAKEVPDSEDVRTAIAIESDLKNLYYIIGLKYMDISSEILSSILSTIKIGDMVNWIEEFSRVKLEMVLDRIWGSKYSWLRDYIHEAISKGDLAHVGRGIEKAVYNFFRSLMLRKPLSFVYVITYLALAEAEYKNLSTIISAKTLELDIEDIERLLI